jgi:DNA-binding transcriptional ArsR family regulator
MTARPAAAGERADAIGVVLAALADPTRRRLLDVLLRAGRASATTISASLPVSRQAVVKHLQVLEAGGLVEGIRAGREVLYTLKRGSLDASAHWLADLGALWDRRLEGMEELTRAADATSP